MLPVKCNQHPWMKMYVNVVKTPFFAVTGEDGKYEIKGLPPGDYTLAFVQEKLGEQTQKVTVAAKDSKTVDAASNSKQRLSVWAGNPAYSAILVLFQKRGNGS